MRQFFWLLVTLMSTFSFLPGCGGTKPPSPDEQKKMEEESKASMEQGMNAMKQIQPNPAKPPAK